MKKNINLYYVFVYNIYLYYTTICSNKFEMVKSYVLRDIIVKGLLY